MFDHRAFNQSLLQCQGRDCFFSTVSPATITSRQAVCLELVSALRKMSKTRTLVMDVDDSIPLSQVDARSMQLRQLGASTMTTDRIEIAQALVQEQEMARGKMS